MATALSVNEWGKLDVIKNNVKFDEIILNKNVFTIGRKTTCDYSIGDNPYLSGVHARFSFETESDSTFLTDLSANGILLNAVRIEKNTNVVLQDGDKITLVLKGTSHFLNLYLKLYLPVGDKTKRKYKERSIEDEVSSKTAEELVRDKPTSCDDDTTLSVIDTTKKSEAINNKQIEVLKKAGYKDIPELSKSESFEEQLLCGVCQEIMHIAVSLQPCLHSYCAGCYSEWMDISRDCPACRSVVDRIAKNHLINNLIEIYLKANPDKRRSAANLAELDKKNKITEDMLYPTKKRLYSTYIEDDDYYSPSDVDEDCLSVPPFFPTLSAAHPIPLSTSLFSLPCIFTKCRQCPGFVTIGTTLSPTTPTPYTCPLTAPIHLLCMCCCQPMPDRSSCTDPSVPPQHCDVCKSAFCNMYWGCLGINCKGCLNEFRNFTFDSMVISSMVNDNLFESEILNNYLIKNNISIKDMLETCLEKLDKNEYKCTDSRSTLISGKTRICYNCAVKNFRDLAFQYRKDIPLEELPEEITARPVCYYGRNCKTQFHKPTHAKKLNHVCEQSRFS